MAKTSSLSYCCPSSLVLMLTPWASLWAFRWTVSLSLRRGRGWKGFSILRASLQGIRYSWTGSLPPQFCAHFSLFSYLSSAWPTPPMVSHSHTAPCGDENLSPPGSQVSQCQDKGSCPGPKLCSPWAPWGCRASVNSGKNHIYWDTHLVQEWGNVRWNWLKFQNK